MKDLIQIAAGELGVKEVSGRNNNPVIVKYAKEAGFKNITDDETPWCSIFVNWVCKQAGVQRSGKANARSWLYVGIPVNNPRPGDIVIFWRDDPESWKGHVGFFMGYTKNLNQVFVLGGNQRNSVSIQAYDADKILGFRSLSSEGDLDIPKPTLKLGSHGEEVRKLQIVLKDMRFDCGATDGSFGPKTQRELKKLQSSFNIKVTGEYNTETQTKIESHYQL